MTLGVAGLRVSFTSNNDGFVEALRPAFQAFELRENPDLLVNIKLLDGPAPTRAPGQIPFPLRSPDDSLIRGDHFDASLPRSGGEGWIRQYKERFPVDCVLKLALGEHVLNQGGLVLHGVGLEFGGRAFLFIGYSGAGKSTLGEYGSQDGVSLLSDELCAVIPSDEGWQIHATPWNIGRPGTARLVGIGLLAHTKTHFVEDIPAREALQTLLPNALMPEDSPTVRARVFRTTSTLLSSVRTLRLSFAKDVGVADVLRRELSRAP